MMVSEVTGYQIIEVIAEGPKGKDGWVARLGNVTSGERIVQQVVDWFGGTGAKPAVGMYVGASGFVSDIADAVDVRGAAGSVEPAAEAAALAAAESAVSAKSDAEIAEAAKTQAAIDAAAAQLAAVDFDENGVRFSTLNADTGADVSKYKVSYADSLTRGAGDKLREMPSVIDAGAVGNGVTNNATAMIRAGNWGVPVFIPADGLYVFSTGVTPRLWGPGKYKRATGPITPSTPFALQARADRNLNGLEPERLNATVIQLRPGSASDSLATDLINSPSVISLNIATVGVNGLDIGTAVYGTGYFIYLLKNSETDAVCAVFSKEISTSLVTKPTGFDRIRKLPWGFVYMAAGTSRLAGIPAYHLCYWARPYTQYTDFSTTADWAVLVNGAATTFTAFSVLPFVPDNARLARIVCVLKTNATGDPARAFLRVTGAAGTGQQVGFATGVGAESIVVCDQRLTSAGDIFYNVSGGGTLSVYVEGYSQTEPS